MSYLLGFLGSIIAILGGAAYLLYQKYTTSNFQLAAEKMKAANAENARKIEVKEEQIRGEEEKQAEIKKQLAEDKNDVASNLDDLADQFNRKP